LRTSARALVAAALLAGFGGLAAAQQDAPESILPPGFGDAPTPLPTPRPTATEPGGAATPVPLPPALPGTAVAPSDDPFATPTPASTEALKEYKRLLAEYELPSFARRSLDSVGPVTMLDGGLPADAFGRADGRWLEQLMRRADAPLASRWLQIALRRALVSRLDTPANVGGADFAAERAWLLLRMGEADAARDVVQAVDERDYTPKLYQIAMQAALATADPAAICGVVDAGRAAQPERAWLLAKPICVALSGRAAPARALIRQARRAGSPNGVDFKLAEKVVGAAPGGNQAVTIEWDAVDALTAWRWGLATATGVKVPDELYAASGTQVDGWRALAAAIPIGDRASPAEAAAGRGVLSNAALVDLYAAIAASEEPPAAANAVASDLAAAYAEPTSEARRAALHRLWGDGDAVPYPRLVLTARAALRLPPRADDPDADRLVAAMLSAGLDRTAQRWAGVVPAGGDAWAMLLLADPDGRGVAYRDLSSYSGRGDAGRKQRLLFAGLAGLRRLSTEDIERAAESLDVRIGAEDSWTRALDRAARAGQSGTVVLLAAIGMQTPDWRGVSPEALYRSVGALVQVGLDGEARMIAAEAIARG
jgi:hypothetical protein